MLKGHELKASALLTFASLSAESVNAYVALATGVCGFVVILPRAVHTLRNTDWKALFTRDRHD